MNGTLCCLLLSGRVKKYLENKAGAGIFCTKLHFQSHTDFQYNYQHLQSCHKGVIYNASYGAFEKVILHHVTALLQLLTYRDLHPDPSNREKLLYTKTLCCILAPWINKFALLYPRLTPASKRFNCMYI